MAIRPKCFELKKGGDTYCIGKSKKKNVSENLSKCHRCKWLSPDEKTVKEFIEEELEVTDTIIKWNRVNMKCNDKNLPEEYKKIVFWNGSICTGVVFHRNGKWYVNPNFGKKEIKTGFLWCYQSDIPSPEVDLWKGEQIVNKENKGKIK